MVETLKEARRKDEEEDDEHEKAKAEVWNYVFGFVEMAAVKCAIELGVADAIERNGGTMTLSQLSSAVGATVSSSHLHRIMRLLVHRRIFKQLPASDSAAVTYVQTPISSLLMKTGETSMAPFFLLEFSPVMLAPWHHLSARILSQDLTAFESAHGEDVWSYAEANPDHSELINKAMACSARVSVPAVVEGCAGLFDGIKSVVDVGGGNGTALRALVKAFPGIRGINFDLPHVVAVSQESEGVENIGGNMFEYVPEADAAFLMWVLHDWGDEECVKILKKCKEAVPEDTGKVIIVEAVIEEGEESKLCGARLMLDLVMMAHTCNGRERTLKDWAHLLHQAGFSRYSVTAIHAIQSVIQAFPRSLSLSSSSNNAYEHYSL